ncbi:roundabout 2-like, partial [Clarias magur]
MSCREKNICVLKCGDETEDSVTWSRDVDGKREKILTVYRNTVTKHIADPDGRYSSGPSLTLSIFRVSHSDAGRYYCSKNTVELNVIAKTETSTQVTARSVKQSCQEKNICVLKCGDETEDSVTWSRDVDGKREKILTVYRNTVTKHIADPNRRYSSGPSLTLSIFRVSHSDAGRYHCNKNTVELNVRGKTETDAVVDRRHTEGTETALFCKHDGSVIWGRGVPAGREDILLTHHGGITIKFNPDPDDRFSVLGDLSLAISDLSLSDSGIYYCNAVPVYNLTVTALQVLYDKTGTEGRDVSLYCGHDGSVIWEKGGPGGRHTILTAKHGEETNPIKHNPDPDHRFSVFSDLSLYIRDLSLSDSGVYYCNAVPVVNLTVTQLQNIMTKSPTTEDSEKKDEEMDEGSGGKDKDNDDEDDENNNHVKENLTITIVVLVSCLVVLLFALPMWRFFKKMKVVQQNQVQDIEYVDLPAAPQPGFSVTQNQTSVDDSINELPDAPQSGNHQRDAESVYFLANSPTSNAAGDPEVDNEGVYFLAAHSTFNAT